MVDLDFCVTSAQPEPIAAAPLMLFRLTVTEKVAPGREPTPIHAVVLSCQIRIEPGRRRYTPDEQRRLVDLFGTPERWGQTLRPMLWTQVDAVARPFTGSTSVNLLVPCSYDFCLAATKYFDALEDGEIPLCFLFSGTIFYQSDDDRLQAAQVPWNKESYFRLPAATWKALMDHYYAHGAWVHVRKDLFDQLQQYKSRRGLASWEQVWESLLTQDKELAAP
jgi:hypothetical protein